MYVAVYLRPKVIWEILDLILKVPGKFYISLKLEFTFQEVTVYFHPTSAPELMTVSTVNGFALPFVMNPGTWTVSIQNNQNLYLVFPLSK